MLCDSSHTISGYLGCFHLENFVGDFPWNYFFIKWKYGPMPKFQNFYQIPNNYISKYSTTDVKCTKLLHYLLLATADDFKASKYKTNFFKKWWNFEKLI